MAHVQTPAGGVVGMAVTSVNLAFGSNVTAGNCIVMGWRYGATGRTVTLSDTLTNTYTSNASGDAVDATDGGTAGIGHTTGGIAGGACTVTFAISGAASILRMSTSEFSGIAAVSPLDKTATASGGAATNPASGAVTPTTDGQLFYCAAATAIANTFTAGTDFTLSTTVPTGGIQRVGAEYYVQPTAVSHDGTLTLTDTTSTWSCALVTLKAATGASASIPVDAPIGPGAVGDLAFQWQQVVGADPVTASADVSVSGLLELGVLPLATASNDVSVAGLLPAGVLPLAPVSHDTSVAGLLELGVVPLAPVSHAANVAGLLPTGIVALATASHDTSVAGLLPVGVFALNGADLVTIGVLYAGLFPLATVSHTATVTGILPAGILPYAPVTHDTSVAGLLELGAVPYAPVSHNVSLAGLLEIAAFALNGPNFDRSVTGWLPVGVAPRSTVTADHTVTGLLPLGVSAESTVSTTRTVAGLLGWAALPSGLITRTVSLIGYLPSGLILVVTGPTVPIFTPPERVFRTGADDRTFRVLAEDRTFRTGAENRTMKP